MIAGKGDKPRPINKTRYVMNFTSHGKTEEVCTSNRITTDKLDADTSR